MRRGTAKSTGGVDKRDEVGEIRHYYSLTCPTPHCLGIGLRLTVDYRFPPMLPVKCAFCRANLVVREKGKR